MKLSVAMCTYNGAKYIRQQIESILNQELKVDEIIVCDDGSKDGTIDIIKEFADKNPQIRFIQNEVNLKLVKNFAKAVSLCTGDIIFLSDQDDVWMPNKSKVLVQALIDHPEMDLVSSDASLIDENSMEIPNESLWKHTHMDCYETMRKIDLVPEFFACTGRVTGATIAFRNKTPYNEFLKYQGTFPFHDETITFLAIIEDKYLTIKDKLTKYRISTTQTVGLDGTYLDRDIRIPFTTVYNLSKLPMNEKWSKRIHFIEERLIFVSHPWRTFSHIGEYKEYYGSYWLSFMIVDLRVLFLKVLVRLHILKTCCWSGKSSKFYNNINIG